jgi:hemicentin
LTNNLYFVSVPPFINNSHVIDEQSVVIGSPAAMHCPAFGTPEPTIRWIREGAPITFLDHPNLRIQDGGHTLQIHNMQLMDIGGYTCVASNVAGNTTKEFLVNILGMI